MRLESVEVGWGGRQRENRGGREGGRKRTSMGVVQQTKSRLPLQVQVGRRVQ